MLQGAEMYTQDEDPGFQPILQGCRGSACAERTVMLGG